MVTVITYGTFDLFHVGHLRLLERARALGDRLVVAVSTDEFNAVKGKAAVVPFEERSGIVAALRCVDRVTAERHWAQKKQDLIRYDAGIFVMGDDWRGKFDHLASDTCRVIYLPRTKGISTTALRQTVCKAAA